MNNPGLNLTSLATLPCRASQVYDISETSALTREEGISLTISAPKVAFTVKAGQQAMCAFVYSTLSLEIPWTFTVILAFDAEGVNTYTWSVPGKYAQASYTQMDTVVTLTGAAKAAGAPAYRASSWCKLRLQCGEQRPILQPFGPV